MEFVLNTIHVWGYPAIFVGGFIEGLNVTLISSFFIAQGIFSPLPVFFSSAIGNFLSDIMWYKLGRKHGNWALERAQRWIPFLRLTRNKNSMERLKKYFAARRGIAILVTKFTIGPGIATQIAAGATGMPLKEYAWYSALANAIFTAVLIGIGYLLGESYVAAAQWIQRGELLLLGLIIAMVLVELSGVSRNRWYL